MEVCFLTQNKLFGPADESQEEKCASSVIPFVVGAQIPFLGPNTKVEGKVGLGSQASGCRMLALAVLGMTASETVSLHFIWYLHPSITSIKGLIFNQALGHLLDTEKLLSFPAKYISVYIFIDIDHPQRPLLLFAVKVAISAHPFCSLEKHRFCG